MQHNYKGGFVIGLASTMPQAIKLSSWNVTCYNGYFWATESSLHVSIYKGPARQVVILGHHFPIGADVDIFDDLVSVDRSKFLDLLDDLSGRFCLLVFEGEKVDFFKDAFGSRAAFYRPCEAGLIASHASLLAELTDATFDQQMDCLRSSEVYRNMSVKYLPGNRTIYEGIRGVPTNHSLNVLSGYVERIWPRVPLVRHIDIEAVSVRLSSYFKSLHGYTRKNTLYFGMTAGADTRLAMAGIIHAQSELQEIRPLHGMIWSEPYSKPEERIAANRIAEKASISITNISVPKRIDEISMKNDWLTGGIRTGSRIGSAIYHGLPQDDSSIFLFGHGGEVMRGSTDHLPKNKITECNAINLAKAYIRRSRCKDPKEIEGVLSIVEKAFAEFIDNTHLHEALSHGYDLNDLFYWEHRMSNWSALFMDEINEGITPLVALHDRKLYDLSFGLPDNIRLTRDYFNRYIEVWVPAWADEPFI